MNNFINKYKNNIFFSTVSLSNQSIYWLDKNGQLLFANDSALETLGYSLKELLSLNVWDVDAIVNTKEKYFDAISHFELNGPDGKPNTIETVHRKKNGEVFPVEVVSKFVTFDDNEYLISYANDISLRLKKEEDIKFYFSLINSSNDMIFLANHETGYVEFANQTACKMLDYTLEELQAKHVSEFRQPLKELDNIEIPEVFNKIETNKEMVTYGVYITKAGKKIPVETSLHLEEYHNKNFIIAISRDISERLNIEKEKEKLNKKLKDYNTTLEEEVEEIKENLFEYENLMKRQSKMAAMGEMLENISHQWRQPLSAVSVLSTGMILQSERGMISKEELHAGLEDINHQSQYLSKTIDDFRNFFKPNKERKKFNILNVISTSIKLSKARYHNEEINFITSIEECEIYNFENELLQVLLNLISNAKDELIKKNYERFIFIDIYKKNDTIVIAIKDNAGGIDESIIGRIFEPYFTTKHNYQGTGIGLYMSEKIISKHMNGTLHASNIEFNFSNKKYTGALFEIKLPL